MTSFFGFLQFFVICLQILQLKYLGFPSLSQLFLDFLISIGTSFPLQIISDPVWQSYLPFVDSYSTSVIATFYSLSDSDALIDKYPNIVLIMSLLVFFFNKKIVCISFVSAFIANTSNFIIKFVMCFFLCLNVSIFHLVSTTLLLLLNAVLTSLTKLSQSWTPLSSSIWLIFFCI